jgi:hypothetical protein
MQIQEEKSYRQNTWVFMVLALFIGLFLIIGAHYLGDAESLKETLRDLAKELGIVLISVWGVSLFYEYVLAERHFQKFQSNLEYLIRRGETNAAACESLGVVEIFRNWDSYIQKHSWSTSERSLGAGDSVRIIGRSLMFSMYAWNTLRDWIRSGATIELCHFNPALHESPLTYLARYSHQETELAIQQFTSKVLPWLLSDKPKGIVEVRFHEVHLLDSLVEIRSRDSHEVVWDLNFGGGTEVRKVLFVDGNAPLGQNLTADRYDLIWSNAVTKFRYQDGAIVLDELPRPDR